LRFQKMMKKHTHYAYMMLYAKEFHCDLVRASFIKQDQVGFARGRLKYTTTRAY